MPNLERYIGRDGTVGKQVTNQPSEGDWGPDEEGYLPISRLKQQYIDYIKAKILEIEEHPVGRHYYHGAHWTAEEIRMLKKRRQPIVTYNRINRKIDGIVGLVEKLRADPKAFPRNPRNASGAEVATQAIRFVLDSIDWKTLEHNSTERCAIEGIGGIEFKLAEGDHGDPDIRADYFFGEDWFYDPRSRRPDFSDARYHGIAKWLDIEAAIELFPDQEQAIRDSMDSGFDLTTHSDQEYKWIYTNERRIRMVEHWYRYKDDWFWCFYVANLVLARGKSPFLDNHRRSVSRFIAWSAAVDHDGDRYGFVRNLKGPQDEINQRRSKGLHISNSRRIIMEKGAVDDVERTRTEWARPDGILEINPSYSDKIKPDELSAVDLKNQLDFLNEAKNEIDSFANVNPALLAAGDPTEHSGVAIDLMQRAGLAELSKFLLYHRTWKMRCYRFIWNTVQQFWTSERWLRITDDQNVQQFIQLNGVGIDRNPQSPNFGRPQIINDVGALDVDIILDEGPDAVNIMQDAYQLLKDDPNIPPAIKIELMPAPESTKQRLRNLMSQAAQQQKPDPKVQAEQIKAQAEMQKAQAEIQKANMAAEAEKFNAQQDAVANQQKQQLAQFQASARVQELQMEMQFKQQEHEMKMNELQAQHADKERDRHDRAAERHVKMREQDGKAEEAEEAKKSGKEKGGSTPHITIHNHPGGSSKKASKQKDGSWLMEEVA